jgi:hypothetical protein
MVIFNYAAQNKMKHNIYSMKFIRIIKFKSVISFLLLVGVLFGGASVVSAATANDTISSVIPQLISITTGTGTVNLPITPTGGGVQTIGSDTVSVSSNDAAGYSLTIASANACTTLFTGTCATPLLTIPASIGTAAAPVIQSVNTWGYCATGTYVPSALSTSCPSATASNQTISATNKFAGITTSAATIGSNSGVVASNTTTVYFAVAANTTQGAGTYGSSVVYTLTGL